VDPGITSDDEKVVVRESIPKRAKVNEPPDHRREQSGSAHGKRGQAQSSIP
jgi:hypothetical protein